MKDTLPQAQAGSTGGGRLLATPFRRLAGAVRRAGFDYRCFHVMRFALSDAIRTPALPDGIEFVEADASRVAASADAVIRDTGWYGGEGAFGFALVRSGRVACLQWLWHGRRLAEAGFWTFGPRDAVSMHLVTVADERERGLATALKARSAHRMRELGFAALYSRIWWTNAASLRVSEKAGWTRVGTTVSVVVPGRRAPLEWRIQRRGAAAR
jgi:RimJ/RimL family protein N-acetyltransferase